MPRINARYLKPISGLKALRRYSRPIERSTGLICDQTIVVAGFYSWQNFDTPLLCFKFKDPETGKRLDAFLPTVLATTNPPKQVCYRWRV